MKKILFTLSLAFSVLAASAQNDAPVSKSGQPILPQAGDFAIGISANPILNYVGNMFNGTFDNEAPTFGEGIGIYGKYFFTDKSALRVKLGFDFSKETTKTLVDEIGSTSTPPAQVTDKTKIGNSEFDLKVGYEMRRGYGRLQGFYGGEIGINLESSTTKYEYGNDLGEDNPTTFRMTEVKSGLSFGFGIGVFAGVEYFIAPKWSIGGEVNLGLALNTAPKGKITSESWNSTDGITTSETESYTANGETRFGTNAAGAIFMMFHF